MVQSVGSPDNGAGCDSHHSHPPCSPVSACHCCVGFEVNEVQWINLVTPVVQPDKIFSPAVHLSRLAVADLWQPPKF